MQNGRDGLSSLRERFQWGSYGFLPGLLLGIFLGWAFSWFWSGLFRLVLTLLLLLPFVLAFLLWRRWNDRGRGSDLVEPRSRSDLDVIDTRAYVVESRAEHPAR